MALPRRSPHNTKHERRALTPRIGHGKRLVAPTSDGFVSQRTSRLEAQEEAWPKFTLFFLAFLPQFVAADEAALPQMLELSVLFMLMTFAVFTLYGASAATARQQVITRPSVLIWLRRGFAAGFLALAARLVFTER
ncbi:LysE family translocator [Billgrantia ethanolica]|uniref:LysE family translocator n=1 Tax=Billgrantia ethanolica TaxID=2733486 RepID=UPI001F2E32AD|nr:hypothetical protein [Halomonas ethanolica]